ncbi:plasmid mobilization protein [Mucilaginibacter paludis]|uniref:Mobilization protein n=1 Tax=Mucilaginibacter paludis DSM 18603 TaxID=714943 RepID=H1YHN3_9SPHI|nr:plasmid mobilization relaxosome protein MobC [Mucilaginibacter paludis]EHQ26456.1 mobilization protein [Mucilaginibacter paludis DSM 18603]
MKREKGQPKLRGRPQKDSGKRTKKIDTRFTEEEYQLILDMEKELGISKTDLIRLRVLENARNVVVNAAALIGSLDTIGAELGRSGNNINQLARYANVLKKRGILSAVVIERFNLLFETYNRQHKEIIIALRQVIRQMGK